MLDEIKIVHEISVEDFLSLRQMVHFQILQKNEAQCILEHTSYISAASFQGNIIGVTRLLYDYGTDAYITDVIVNPQYQGQGVGRMLIEDVVAYVKNHSFSNVRVTCNLYANVGKEAFYEKLGFSKLPFGKYGYGMLIAMHEKEMRFDLNPD